MRCIENWALNKLAFNRIPVRLLILEKHDFQAQWNTPRRSGPFTSERVAAVLSRLVTEGTVFSQTHTTGEILQLIDSRSSRIRRGESIPNYPHPDEKDDILVELTSNGIANWEATRCYCWDSHVDQIGSDEWTPDSDIQVSRWDVIAASRDMAARVLMDPYFYMGELIVEDGTSKMEHVESMNVTYWKCLHNCVKMRVSTCRVEDMDDKEILAAESFANELRIAWFQQQPTIEDR